VKQGADLPQNNLVTGSPTGVFDVQKLNVAAHRRRELGGREKITTGRPITETD